MRGGRGGGPNAAAPCKVSPGPARTQSRGPVCHHPGRSVMSCTFVRRLARRWQHAVFAGAAVLAFAPPAAGAYPERPIRLVVPSSPGGGTDTTMRIVTPRLGELLGQRVVIDNRPGQAGNIGLEIAARAPADGYTLAAMIASNASNP